MPAMKTQRKAIFSSGAQFKRFCRLGRLSCLDEGRMRTGKLILKPDLLTKATKATIGELPPTELA